MLTISGIQGDICTGGYILYITEGSDISTLFSFRLSIDLTVWKEKKEIFNPDIN